MKKELTTKELTKKEILGYLEEINHKLTMENKYGEILIAGGAALTLVFNARNSTHDVDAVFRPKEDLRSIIENIAACNDLEEDWLNDGVKGFITPAMKSNVFIEYSNLTVSNLDAESLLAMKLTSARTYSKDMDDSIFLMKTLDIKSQDELFNIIEKYTHSNQQTIQAQYFTIEAYEKYCSRQELEKADRGNKEKAPRRLSEYRVRIEEMKKADGGKGEIPQLSNKAKNVYER